MSNIFQIQAKDVVLKLNQHATINAVQNFNWDPAFNEEYLQELGNDKYSSQSINPDLTGSFESMATGSTYAVLSRMVQDLGASGDFQGYKFVPASPNTGTLRHTDLEYAVFDLIVNKRANEIFTRSEWFPRLFLTSLSFSADATGNARETYGFEGQLMQLYRSPYHDLISVPLKRASSTTATLDFSTSDVTGGVHIDTSAGALTNVTHTLVCLQVNEVIVPGSAVTISRDTGVDTTAGTEDDVYTYTLTGYTIPVGARIMALAYKDTPGSFPTIYNPNSARFVRANNIDMWLIKKSDLDTTNIATDALNAEVFSDSYDFLRVQSFDLNIDLRREVLRQIKKQAGLSSVYYRAASYPLQITASATTFESDLDAWLRFQNKSSTPANADDVLDLAQFEGKEMQLVIRYYYGDTVMQTMVLEDARVTGMGYSVGVGGRSEINWSFTGSSWRLEGDTV